MSAIVLLSVIIPAYNAQTLLEQAVRSVLAQPCAEIEIWIINDGSVDSTGQIADRLAREDPRVRVIHTENQGAAHARNLGLDAAAGDYVGFLDADDVWCANAVDGEVERVLRSGQYDMLRFGYFHGDPELHWGKAVPVAAGALQQGDPGYNRAVSGRSFCSFLLRRPLLKDLRFPERIRYHEDITFLFLFARKSCNILLINRYLFVYRNHLASAMHAMPDWRYILTDEIPAWQWARSRAAYEKDRADCDGMIYSLMWDYLRRSALLGVPGAALAEDMERCEAFRDAMTRFGSFWTSTKAVTFFRHFQRNPKGVCRIYRILGWVPRILRRLLRRPQLRTIYLRLKYRTSLNQYVR